MNKNFKWSKFGAWHISLQIRELIQSGTSKQVVGQAESVFSPASAWVTPFVYRRWNSTPEFVKRD